MGAAMSIDQADPGSVASSRVVYESDLIIGTGVSWPSD
jgi:hypothetical protein